MNLTCSWSYFNYVNYVRPPRHRRPSHNAYSQQEQRFRCAQSHSASELRCAHRQPGATWNGTSWGRLIAKWLSSWLIQWPVVTSIVTSTMTYSDYRVSTLQGNFSESLGPRKCVFSYDNYHGTAGILAKKGRSIGRKMRAWSPSRLWTYNYCTKMLQNGILYRGGYGPMCGYGPNTYHNIGHFLYETIHFVGVNNVGSTPISPSGANRSQLRFAPEVLRGAFRAVQHRRETSATPGDSESLGEEINILDMGTGPGEIEETFWQAQQNMQNL